MNLNKPYLTVKDYSVSQEEFKLYHDSELDLLKTIPQPSESDLPKYYNSEDYISHTDSKRTITEWLYHIVRFFMLKKKLKLINRLSRDTRKLLDFGCGTGEFLKVAHDNGWDVLGIERNSKARELAQKKVNGSIFENDKLSELPNNHFDIICMWHVLEHLPDFNFYISELRSKLKHDGALIIAVPNYKSFDAEYYKDFWAAFDVPRHLWHFSKNAIKKIASNHKLIVSKILPLTFDAYYVSLLSEKYKTGNSNLWKAFKVGFKSNRLAKSTNEYSSLIYILKKN